MAAQRGYFTVHGTDVRGLDLQLSHRARVVDSDARNDETVLAKATLTPLAAIYAVRYVVQFVGLDSFSVFRDEDNLGVMLKEFMRRK